MTWGRIRASWLFPTAVLGSALVLTGMLWQVVTRDHGKFVTQRFQHEMDRYAAVAQSEVDLTLEAVNALAALYRVQPTLDAATFDAFASRIVAHHTSLQALEWVPQVRADQRAVREQDLRDEGFQQFAFRERAPQGGLRAAGDRDVYFPVYFVTPFEGNESAHGFDLRSNPTRRAALELARDTGKFSVTSKIELVQKGSGSNGFLAFAPVYDAGAPIATNHERRKHHRGFMLGVYDVQKLMDVILGPLNIDDADLWLFDATDAVAEPEFLYRHQPEATEPTAYASLPDAMHGVPRYERDIHLPGRVWTLAGVPTSSFVAALGSSLPDLVLVGGVILGVLSALTASFATAMQDRALTIARVNAELDKRNRALDETNQELESFSYTVSHDLRAPLRHITGFVQLLREESGTLSESSSHYLEVIERSSARMGELIDALLKFSRTGRAELRRVDCDLNRIVRDVIDGHSHQVQDRDIDWTVDALPGVHVDPTLMRVVVDNLVSNAIKYTEHQENARIHVRGEADRNDQVVLSVRDNGVGFDMAYVDKLFGVFQRLHRHDEFAGTGIGLATVRRIVHRHGGRVWAEGQVDEGATIFCSLPAAETPRSHVQ